MNVTPNELKNNLDQYLDMAETAPVIVEKPGKIRLALISYSVYEHLKKLDDGYWLEQAKQAESEGWLGHEASESFLKKFQQD